MFPELNGFQRDCLYAIAGLRDQNGLEAKAKLDRYYGRTINHRTLYQHLDRLVEAGLVEKRQLDGRANAYNLTRDGLSAIMERRHWEVDMVKLPGSGPGVSIAGP